jgi:SAM-dependent methyltransferase
LGLLNEMGFEAAGVDQSEELLAKAALKGRVIKAPLSGVPLPDGWADAVLAECVLNLLEDRGEALREFTRLLREGGYLIIGDLAVKSKSLPTIKNPRRARGLGCAKGADSVDMTITLLKSLGFGIVSFQDHEKTLRDLSARLVWRYGLKEGLGRLGLMGANCRFKPGDLTYVRIVAQKLPL